MLLVYSGELVQRRRTDRACKVHLAQRSHEGGKQGFHTEEIECSWSVDLTTHHRVGEDSIHTSTGERSLGWWMLLYIQWGTKSWKARHWEVRNLFSLLSSYESELVKGDIENFQLSCMVECWNAIFRWKDGELVSSVKHHGDGKQFVVQVFWSDFIHLWCFSLKDWQDLEQLEELTKNPTPGV